MPSQELQSIITRLKESYPETQIKGENEQSLMAALEANSEVVFDAMDQELRNIQISSALEMAEDFSDNTAMVARIKETAQKQILVIDEYLQLCDKYLQLIPKPGKKRDSLITTMNRYRTQLPSWKTRLQNLP